MELKPCSSDGKKRSNIKSRPDASRHDVPWNLQPPKVDAEDMKKKYSKTRRKTCPPFALEMISVS
eukprot:scaffold65_cov102-Cylindrotheca_fusiformis.AAC.3